MYSNAYPSRASDYRDTDIHELNFTDEQDPFLRGEDLPVQDEQLQSADLLGESASSESALAGQEPTADDLMPETLLHEDGASDPRDSGDDLPNDQQLTIVDGDEIGGGQGLDEAVWARVDPLDGKPWPTNRP